MIPVGVYPVHLNKEFGFDSTRCFVFGLGPPPRTQRVYFVYEYGAWSVESCLLEVIISL